MLESHDLEGHVAGGQDEDADSANMHAVSSVNTRLSNGNEACLLCCIFSGSI